MDDKDPRFDPDLLAFLDERYGRKTPEKPPSEKPSKPKPRKASPAPKSPETPGLFRLFCALVDLVIFCIVAAKYCRY